MLTPDVINKKVPFVYGLSQGKKPFSLELKMDKNLILQSKNLSSAIFVKELLGDHKFKSFSLLGNDYFGYDQAFKKNEETEKTISYLIEIPVLPKESSLPCVHCLGTGWDRTFGHECFWCHGKKRETRYDWKPFFAISASLQIFSFIAETSVPRKICKDSQLLTFQIFCGMKMNSFPIFGSYGYDFCNWLNSFPEYYSFEKIKETMSQTYEHIFKEKKDWHFFDAYVGKDAWLIIDCPGEASGLHPTKFGWNKKKSQGQQYSCHNIDSPIQQLILLVALAGLSDLARESINKK